MRKRLSSLIPMMSILKIRLYNRIRTPYIKLLWPRVTLPDFHLWRHWKVNLFHLKFNAQYTVGLCQTKNTMSLPQCGHLFLFALSEWKSVETDSTVCGIC